MSPRAAWRLETLGFTQVHDYTAGEADWFAYGLPMEGAQADVPRVGALARRDIPSCELGERIGHVRERARTAGWEQCVVVNGETVVLGLLRARELDADPDATAEQVMRSGPATYRPDALAADVLKRLDTLGVAGVLVTRPDGTLIGWMRREDAARADQSPAPE